MTINSLLMTNDGQLWIGTYSDGLLKVENNTIEMALPQEVPIPNIAGILEDQKGCLWVSSNNGLYKFNPTNKHLQHFLNQDELQSKQFNIDAFAKDSTGRMYFGGSKGMNVFYPDNIQESFPVSTPLIVRIKKYDRPLYFDHPIQELSTIELAPKDQFVSFDFMSIDYASPKNLQYAYKLEGLHHNWVYCQQQRSTSFTNLPAGNYQLRIKAGDLQGNWNPQETSIQIKVHPPFYQTRWFILLTCFVFFAMLFAIHQLWWYFKMIKLREIDRVRAVAASDFHDELGHRLTKISLFTETIFQNNPQLDQGVKDGLVRIRNNSAELYHSMRDFIWAMNPQNDTVFELAILLKDFGDELYSGTNIHFEADGISGNSTEAKLDMNWKRNIVLIFKEAMHNALKHSNCRNVQLTINCNDELLEIELKDDGKGFIPSTRSQGYGLSNMQNRAKKINGSLQINSIPENSTTISFIGKIKST